MLAVTVGVPGWVWPVWVVLTLGCGVSGGRPGARAGAPGGPMAGWWRARAASNVGATASRRRASSAGPSARRWFQRRAEVATLIAATAAGAKHYRVLDVPADLAWAVAAEASPWVANRSGHARFGERPDSRGTLGLRQRQAASATSSLPSCAVHLVRLLSHHGDRWSALRHRRRPGDVVETDRRCRRARCATLADHQIARSYLTNTTTRTRVQIADLLTEAGHGRRARRGHHRRRADRRLRPRPLSRCPLLPGEQRRHRR